MTKGAAEDDARPGTDRAGRGRSHPAPSDGRLVLRAGDPLLAGTETEADRRARRRLLRELLEAGVPREDLERAVAEERLALLPAEVVLSGRRRLGDGGLERSTGLSREDFAAYRRASGLAGTAEMTSGDLAAARSLRRLLDAGLPLRDILEVAGVAGQGVAYTSRAIVRVVGRNYLRPGDSEYDLGARLAAAASELVPLLGPLLEYQLRAQLREALRHETIGRSERVSGRIDASREVAVAFADLVGFTRLGSRVHADEVGRIAARLLELANQVVSPPVTVVKTLGDAVMLVSPDAARLVEDVVALVQAVDAEGADFPQLRAGVALGPAVPLGGDWYGHAVNLASRVTAVARPNTVLGTLEVRAAAQDRFSWTRALPRHLRGVPGAVFVARVRGRKEVEVAGGAFGGRLRLPGRPARPAGPQEPEPPD